MKKSVRVIYILDNHSVLLMGVNNPNAYEKLEDKNTFKWFTIGGTINEGENIREAAIREIFEETGHSIDDFESDFVPKWHGTIDLHWQGEILQLYDTFIVARTQREAVKTSNMTEEEQEICKGLQWWSIDDLQQARDCLILPVNLYKMLQQVIENNLPTSLEEISLSAYPPDILLD